MNLILRPTFGRCTLVLVLGLLLAACAPEPSPEAPPSEPPTVSDPPTGYRRMVEDVPVEDRKLLADTTLLLPKAGRRAAAAPAAAIEEHRAVELPADTATYWLVAGSFTEQHEAQLLVNFFETEGLKAEIVPNKNLKRVVLPLRGTEPEVRSQRDSLVARFQGLIEFWFLRP